MAGSRQELQQYFNRELSGTAYAVLLTDMFSTEWMEWSPSVLRAELAENHSVIISDNVSDKLQAVSVLHTTDAFTTQLEAFTAVCKSLNGIAADLTKFVPAELDSLLIGCTEAGLHIGKLNKVHPDIKVYTGVILDYYGIYEPPGVLNFAQYPTDAEKGVERLAETTEFNDKDFWIEQKEIQNGLEGDSFRHIKRILEEIKQLPVDIDQDEAQRLEKAVNDAADVD